MDVREIDYRYSWTRETLQLLDQAIQRLFHGSLPDGSPAPVYWDGDGGWALEQVEELVGLGLASMQAYIRNAQSDLMRVRGSRLANEWELRGKFCPSLAGVGHVEAIWEAANYYKHHDDWRTHWSQGCPHSGKDVEPGKDPDSHTLGMLQKLGVNCCSEPPYKCLHMIELIDPTIRDELSDGAILSKLLPTLGQWRERLFDALRDGSL